MSCDDLGHWSTADALGQWHVMPWGNPGSWHRGAMPGDSPVGWFSRNPNLWFWAQSAKWLKKDLYLKKNLSKLGNSSNFMLSIIMRVFISDSILCHFIIWEQMAQFLFHRKYLGNDKKINKKINWEVTHHNLIFFLTLLEIGSLFLFFQLY